MATAFTTTGIARYRDLDLNFNVHPVRKDINILTDEQSVITSVKNLIMMNFYEKPFHPEIGCNVRRMLFDNIDEYATGSIASVILIIAETQYQDTSVVDKEINVMAMFVKLMAEI
jgi:hypothetical protein